MSSAWPVVRLGEMARIKHGFAFSGMSAELGKDLPVVVGIGNFNYSGGFRFDSTNLKRFAGDFPEEYELHQGDVLLAMTCQTPDGEILGVPGRIPKDGVRYLHNQRLGLLQITDNSRLDQGYFFQFARTQQFNRQLFATASGSKILHTSPGRIEDALIPVPPIVEQKAISSALSSLDDKIESNRNLVSIIVKLISAKIESQISQFSEIVPISSLARFVNGGAYTKGASGTGRMVLRIAELNKGPGSSTVYNEIDVPEDRLARPGDILMSWSGSIGVYRWKLDEAIVNQHIFKVIPTKYPNWLVFNRLHEAMPIFQGLAADKATTMGHIQRGHLDSTEIRIPSSASIVSLQKELGPIWERLIICERETMKLEKFRDTLIPELVFGRIRISEATK